MFKLAALRLADHTLIISRQERVLKDTKKKSDEPWYEITIGMLSSKFIKDSGSSKLVAPIVSFRMQKKANMQEAEDYSEACNLEPLTPLPDKFLGLIHSYTRLFKNFNKFMKHIFTMAQGVTQVFKSGTEFYFCDLKDNYESSYTDIKVLRRSKLESELSLSLYKKLCFTYIDFPETIQIKINEQLQQIQNPFMNILQFVNDNSE